MEDSSIIQSKIQLLQPSVAYQKQNYAEWFKNDRELLNQYQLMQTFRKLDPSLSFWEGKDFVELSNCTREYQLLGNWNSVTSKLTGEGLHLQQYIIRSPSSINLRSLAADIKINFVIGFQSTLLIFARVVDKLTGNTPVLKLIKDVNIAGIFFVFGSIDPETNKFKFIKMNQITDLLPRNDPFRELEISITDNGDDKMYIRISSSGQRKSIVDFNFCCYGFVPELRDSQLWVAGVGESVHLKSLSIQYKERVGAKIPSHRPNCACTIS